MPAAYRLDTDKTWNETYKALVEMFSNWPGANLLGVEPNVPMQRVNGTYFSTAEAAVTLRYKKGEREVTLTYDKQSNPRSNLRALYLCLDDMRMIERRGLDEVVRSAYLQLNAPKKKRDPWEVLGLRPGASREDVEAMFRVRARTAHPDHGGSDEAMAELNAARAEALGEAAPA